MKILILGGTGVMGKELVSHLITAGKDVIVTSRSAETKDGSKIKYITGNAMDSVFLNNLLSGSHYDAIVDFMNYSTEVFRKRLSILLKSTDQYVFLSSCRVYAESYAPINEESELLIDVCKDYNYVQSDEYAIAKARQERLLIESGHSNWTIIRPYITYGKERLQLGFMEKELWLYRILHDRSLVIGSDICDKITTLTSGDLVSLAISKLIGNKSCLGQIYTVARPQSVYWKEILKVYLDTIEAETGKRPKIILQDNSKIIGKVSGRWEQIKYDRLYDRKFDSSKMISICSELNNDISLLMDLKNTLESFLKSERNFRGIDWRSEGYMDKIANELTPLSEINGSKNKLKYLVARFTPYYELMSRSAKSDNTLKSESRH